MRGTPLGLKLLGLALLLGGCASWQRIDGGTLATDGVAIRAVDSSFTFLAKERFSSPFGTLCWRARVHMNPSVGDWQAALSQGAKAVRVRTPWHTEELYGVLALCQARGDDTRPAARSYRIQVPQSYVDATANGVTSLVWEPSGGERGVPRYATWILWLSREPMP